MKSSDQNVGLYPIIRRVRRPLLPLDPPKENKPLPISQAGEAQPRTAEGLEVVGEKKADAEDSNK
jgi:hypothetical protein